MGGTNGRLHDHITGKMAAFEGIGGRDRHAPPRYQTPPANFATEPTYVLPSPQRLLRLRPSRSLKLACFLLCGRDDVGFQATQQHRVIGVVKGRDNLWVLCQRIGKQSPFRLRPEQEWSNRDGEQAWNNGGQFLRNAPRISEVGNYETGQVSKGGDGFSEIPISRLLEIE